MIYLASYEPGGSLYNREREHILGRSPVQNRVLGVQRAWNLISAIQRVWWSALWRTERWARIRNRFVRLRRA